MSLTTTLRTGERHLIHVRTMEFQVIQIPPAQLPQRLPGLHGMLVAFVALPDGKRCAPVALAGEGPIYVVLQPIAKTTVFDVVRIPVHLLVGGDEIIFPGRGDYVPGCFGVVDQCRIARPAMRVAVCKFLLRQQQPSRLKISGDGTVRILDEKTLERGYGFCETHIFVHGHDERKPVRLAYSHVVRTEGGSDMDDTRALVRADEIPWNYVPGIFLRLNKAEGWLILSTFQISPREGLHHLGALAKHRHH